MPLREPHFRRQVLNLPEFVTEGGSNGNGIGAADNHLCRSLLFVNGTFNASSRSDGGAEIGCGFSRDGNSRANITVLGRSITESGWSGAAIGSGCGFERNSDVSELQILGGNLAASGSYSNGIGSGYGYYGTSTLTTCAIWGRNITASGLYGAGIRSRLAAFGASSVSNFTILGSNITASGSNGA